MTQKFPPDSILLISDLHLDTARPDISRAFFDFLGNTATDASALYILGDLFNVWLGDDDCSPFHDEICSSLKQLSRQGTAIYLMHGNRDFLLGSQFAAACGATMIDDPHVLEHHGERYLLMHGDVLCTRDIDYMNFRKMVRNAPWQAEFLAASLTARRAFADQARARSKSMSSSKPADIMDVTPSEVDRVLEHYAISTLIHGHTHRPAEHKIFCAGKPCKRIVLGDWDDKGWYLQLGRGEPVLQSFPIQG